MAKGRKSSVSAKNSLSLFFLGIIVLIVLIGAFALQQKDGFSLLPRASTTTRDNMCQRECILDYQCGQGQICAQKPGSIDRKKYCYNPSCPENTACGGEGCGGECRLFDELKDVKSRWSTLKDCINSGCEFDGKTVCKKDIMRSDYACVTNLCEKDFTETLNEGAYIYSISSKSMCPDKDTEYCPKGFQCDKIIGNGMVVGFRATRITDPDYGYFWAGKQCMCQSGYCSEGEYRYITNIQRGQYVECRFDTAKCEGPFNP